MSRPASSDPAIKKSFSLPTSLYDEALKRMKELGYKSESAYIQYLIREDTLKRGAHLRLPVGGEER